MSDLTPKQEKFCQKYIELGNASEAYRQSYDVSPDCAPETIWCNSSQLLSDTKVSQRVKELKEFAITHHQVTVGRVLEEYAKLAFLDIRKAFDEQGNLRPIHELDGDTAAAISGLEVETKQFEGKEISRLSKLKLSDKKGSLDSLAKHLAMFVERHEHTGKDGGAIETKDVTNEDAARRIAFLLASALKDMGNGN